MAVEYKEYLNVDGQEYKASIYYDKGIKYWLVIVPVTITKKDNYQMEEYGAFTGLKCDLLLVTRKSAKKT